MENNRFEELKEIILKRAKGAQACTMQYGRAYRASSLEELMEVVRDNFHWSVQNGVINGNLIDTYKDEFNAGNIWHNENVTNGFLLASGSSTVEAYGSSTVEAYGSSTVEAYGSSTVEAYDNSTVRAYDNSTVRASDNSTVRASDNSTVEAYDNSTVEAYSSSTVRASGSSTVEAYGSSTVRASGSSTVEAYGSSTVEAYGSSYIISLSAIECKLNDNAINRILISNEIRYSNEHITFRKV